MEMIMNALFAEANAKETRAAANLQNYMNNSVGVGEHPDIVAECNKLVKEIAEAREMKSTIQSLLPKEESEKQ
tara:strand:- start:911 stop:1129 length:219 start_codon:yes stop_codon:yes gene_type:complete